MRYEDASNSFQASGPSANDDSDTLPAGSREPATGNLITGEGTQYGAAGADSAAGGHITSIAGKGGEDSSFSGGKLSVAGEHGNLSVDAEGNYIYRANNNAPENVRDRFTYTLADNQGNSDTAALVVELGKTPVVIKADAQQIVPGPDGVVTLPPGVELSDVMVVGRNLVINMPDGTQLIIVDGAIFVPQLVLDGVSVPATNVAALLIGQEPQPAAGELPPSSGGNFALPPPPLDPGVPLGDLLPPTDRGYIPPEPEELFPEEDSEPEITIQPDGQPASVNAVDEVDEAGLPVRNGGEPEGSGEEAAAGANGDTSEATSGVIHIDSPDEPNVITINGIAVTSVGQVIPGEYGTLTITSISDTEIGYAYTLTDNIDHSDAQPDQDDFSVTVTDVDGDQATATLTINIIDDEPTARNDVDSVVEGGPEVADGNVLTGSGGADANSTDGVADTVGADDADLTGFSQGGNNGTLGAPFDAQYGTLVLNADGSYTYTLDSEDPAVRALGDGETLTEVFTYTIVDGDGDVDTATLTITIVGTNEAPVIGNAEAVVSEEGLPGGIEDTDGDPSDTTNLPTDSGTISVSDSDGDPVTVTLSLVGLPALTSNDVPIDWALSDGGHTLTGTADGNTIITITIDNDGNYTVTLDGPIDHGDETAEDIRTFNVQVIADDGSETDTGTLTVTIEDDSPVVTGEGEEPQLLADESDFTVNDTQNFGDVFDIQFGGDGGDPDSVTYELGTPGGDSGLVDTLTGEAVVLSLEGGEVVGRAGPGGPIVFVVSVNADGDVTVDQRRAVVHEDETDHNDTISLADDNLITLTATATDNDGDEDSATINIGKNVVLADDGPDISRNQTSAPDLVTDDTDTPNTTDGPLSFAGLFDLDFGADGFKDVDDNDVEDADAVVFSLSLKDGNGTDSGLNDVLTGDNILLRVVGNTIEGYLEGDDTVVAFTLTLDPNTGQVSQEQDRAITHDDPGDPVEDGADAETMASDLIVITATITDGDLDTASATANIGDSFHFEDDGPDAFNEAQQDVAEGQTITGEFDFDPGADGATVTHINGIALVFGVGGWSQWIPVDDGQIRAQADGSYEFEADDNASGVTSGNFTVTDGDGDPDTATWAFNITDANSPTAGSSDAKLDDDGLSGNNPASTTGDIDANDGEVPVVDTNEAVFHGDLNAEFGGDGAGTISFAGMVGQFRMVGTERVHFTWDPVTLTLTAVVDAEDGGGNPQARAGTELFELVLDPSLNGNYTLTLLDNVLHAAGGNETSAPNVELSFVITDSDNSPPGGATGTLNIEFNDDAPTITRNGNTAPTLVTDDTDTPNDTAGPTSFAGLFTGVFGADGPKDSNNNGIEDADALRFSFLINGGNGTDSGLNDVLSGDNILLRVVGNTIEGYLEGSPTTVAFTITLNPDTGAISLEQDRAIVHDNPADPIETGGSAATLSSDLIKLVATIEDGDGDTASATANIGNSFQFEDDGPSISRNGNAAPTLVTDDTLTPNDTDSASFANLFTGLFGKDGFKDADDNDVEDADAIRFNLSIGGPNGTDSGLNDTLTGDNILLRVVGNTIEGYLEGSPATVAFTISINPDTGQVTLEQDRAVVHDNPADPSETGGSAATLAAGLVVITATIEDGDGDTASATANIGNSFQFEDDGPSISRNGNTAPTLVTDDTDTPNDTAGPTSFAGLFNSGFGKDGFKDSDDNDVEDADAIRYVLQINGGNGTDSGLNDTLSGNNILLRVVGNTIEGYVEGDPTTIAFTITLDPNTGAISLEQDRPIVHDNPADPVETGGSAATMSSDLIKLVAIIEDGDGDTASATANIGNSFQFEDDGPTISRNGTTAPTLVTDDTDTPDDTAGPTSFAGLFTSSFGKDSFKDSDDNDVEDANALRYSLSITGGNGTDSGLDDAVTGVNILLRVVGNTIEGYLEGSPTTVAFTITVNPDTGTIALEQDRAIEHNDPADPIETGGSAATLAASLVVLTATIEDGDGDTASATANIGNSFQFEDDGPSLAVQDPLEIDNDATPTGTGTFDMDVGADSNSDNDDIFVDPDTFSITINGDPAQNVILFTDQDADGNPLAETATTASYRFTFEYDTGTGGTAEGEGTLVFDKTSGEYTVTLTSGPIEGISFASISTGQPPVGYEDGSDTLMPSNPDVSVVQIDTDLFVQFTGYMEPGSGTGANNFKTSTDNEVSAGDDENFANGEILVQERDYVTISGLGGNGVHGDTMNKGDILDFDLFTSNPTGHTDLAPTAQVETMFLWLDGIGANEDMIVILKLYDTVTDTFTTKAVYVANTEIFKNSSTDAGIYQSLIDDPNFDNNDGLIVIEQSDYNTALEPDRYVIVGAQMTISDEGIVGSAIALNGDVGVGGESTGTTTFAADTNDTGFKIKDIGFLTTSTEDQQATIEFDVTVTDADGDSVTQTDVTVNIGGAAIPFAPMTSLMAFDSQEEQLQKTVANSNTLTLATAVAAAGLSGQAAAENSLGDLDRSAGHELAATYDMQVEQFSVSDDGGDAAVSMLAPEASAEASAPADTSSSSSSDNSSADNSLNDSAAQAAPESNDAPAADDGGSPSSAGAEGPVAPTVAMVSAEALQAVASDGGDAQQGGSVEQIVADALNQGNAPDLDAVLANLPGGNGGLQAIAHMASPDVAAVSGWDTGGHGAVGAGFDMMFKMDVAMHHQDAVQPVQNG